MIFIFSVFMIKNIIFDNSRIKSVNNSESISKLDSINNLKSSGNWELSPIYINDNDPNYNWSKTATENDWCRGNGTLNDPYIIENSTINGQYTYSCLAIEFSNAYFVIRNCTFFNSGESKGGIYFNYVENGIIDNNNLSNNYYGIYIASSNINTFSENNVSNNSVGGIILMVANNNTFSRNKVNKNPYFGISLYQSNNNTLIENIADENQYGGWSIDHGGISLRQSNYNRIKRNNISNNYYGVKLEYSSYNSISGNTFSSNEQDIYEENCVGNIIENNFYVFDEVDNTGNNLLLFIVISVIFFLLVIASALTFKHFRKKKRLSETADKVPLEKWKIDEMDIEEFKGLILIRYIYFIFIFIFAISSILPYNISINFNWVGLGILQLMYGGWIGLLIASLSIILLFYYKIKYSIAVQLIGYVLIGIDLIIVMLYKILIPQEYDLGLGFYIGFISWIGLCVLTLIIFRFRKVEVQIKKKKEEFQERKIKTMTERIGIDFDKKNRLFGMINAEKQINIEIAFKDLKIPEDEIKGLIYDLVGEGKIKGEFQGKNFIITSDIDDFLKALDASFLDWEQNIREGDKRKIKKTILDLGTKFTRLQIMDISEKSGIQEEESIIEVISDMIKNKEIYAEYFKDSKSIAFNQQANIDEIDKLMEVYDKWQEKKIGKR